MNTFTALPGIARKAAAVAVLGAAVVLAAACGSQRGTGPAGSSASTRPAGRGSSPAKPESSLTISVAAARGGTPRRVTLTCEPAGGTHPQPQAACDTLARARNPFAPVPPGIVKCSMIYGGPQTASITGVWNGKRVAAAYSRDNGCQIERWNKIAPVLNGLNPGGPMIPAAG